MILLSGKPPGAGKEATGWSAFLGDVSIQQETTTGGKSSLLDSPSRTTRGVSESSGYHPLATRDEMAPLVSLVREKRAQVSFEKAAAHAQHEAEEHDRSI